MQFLDDVDVRLIQHMGSDLSVIAAARVSTQGEQSLESLDGTEKLGLINFLMKNRHGTPFEHAAMTFYIKAPIFVFREFHRHRIGWSYNEESARYKVLEPDFYTLNTFRPGIKQAEGGRPGHYQYEDATSEEVLGINNDMIYAYKVAYQTYLAMIKDGVAKEVARMCLPVGIFSSMYATCNPRSLMAFLGLRTKREAWDDSNASIDAQLSGHNPNVGRAKFPSKPQYEINRVADLMELEFQKLFPVTYEAFNDNGRVCP